MELRRCTRGIAALALVLGGSALFFDDLALGAAAGALAGFLVYRSYVFARDVRRVAAAWTIVRQTDHVFVRQGSEVCVTTSILLDHPTRLALGITDLPPDGVRITGGANTATLPPHTPNPPPLRYRFTNYTSGRMPFRGVAVTFADPFFRTAVTFRREGGTDPHLQVLPEKPFAYESSDRYGEQESARRTPLPGYSIHSYREYAEGDPQKHIDWKLTAKFNKRIVREYMGRRGGDPLIIVDLPERGSAVDAAAFTLLKEKVASTLTAELHRMKRVSIAVISGPNIITTLHQEPDMHQVLQVIQHLAPVERRHHLYRSPGAAPVRQRLRNGSPEGDDPFISSLGEVARQFSTARQQTLFERHSAALLQSAPSSDVLLFSTVQGDASHIWLLALMAEERGMNLRLYLPHALYTPQVQAAIGRYPFTGVEAVS